MNSGPDISLPRFEGPLALLLHLVRSNEIDISDIPIAEITRQYLDYLHRAEEMDIDLGAEFSYIAALLIHIKSRALLATDPAIAPAGADDPRQELARLLMQEDELRNGAEFLKQKLEIAQATWSKCAQSEWEPEFAGGPPLRETMNLLDILRLARQALETAQAYEVVYPAESVTVEEMQDWLKSRLMEARDGCSANTILLEQTSMDRRAALFLAMLELAKTGDVVLDQDECFGPIALWRPCAPRHNCALT